MLTSQLMLRISRQKRERDQFINRVVARAEAAVWSRIYPTAATMDLAQARGYIRARSALVVSRELQIAIGRLPSGNGHADDELRQVIIERLVHRMLGGIAVRRPPSVSELRAA